MLPDRSGHGMLKRPTAGWTHRDAAAGEWPRLLFSAAGIAPVFGVERLRDLLGACEAAAGPALQHQAAGEPEPVRTPAVLPVSMLCTLTLEVEHGHAFGAVAEQGALAFAVEADG